MRLPPSAKISVPPRRFPSRRISRAILGESAADRIDNTPNKLRRREGRTVSIASPVEPGDHRRQRGWPQPAKHRQVFPLAHALADQARGGRKGIVPAADQPLRACERSRRPDRAVEARHPNRDWIGSRRKKRSRPSASRSKVTEEQGRGLPNIRNARRRPALGRVSAPKVRLSNRCFAWLILDAFGAPSSPISSYPVNASAAPELDFSKARLRSRKAGL